MTDLKSLSERMKADWNRRIKHDYLFWMSDGRKDEKAMWESGDRDFAIITKGITNTSQKSILEIGCGVGRLLRPALNNFAHVVGLDVSEQAISKAREFLGSSPKLSLHAGNGVDLHPLEDGSLNVVYSFAALTSMPVKVIAKYLSEAHRVLCKSGTLRLQVYLGAEQELADNDTLHMRCFSQDNFVEALKLAGFDLEWIEELQLPFQVSFKEAGIIAYVTSFIRSDRAVESTDSIADALLPGGEASFDGADADLEYWMALNFADELADDGDVERAKAALDYANNFQKTVSIDVRDLLDRVVNKIDKTPQIDTNIRSSNDMKELPKMVNADVFEKNLRILKDLFPEVYSKVVNSQRPTSDQIEVKETEEGYVISFAGQVQDHVLKPVSGGRAWAERALQDLRLKSASHVAVYGFGAGYHLEELGKLTEYQISAVEPRLEVFKQALALRDLEVVFKRLGHIVVGDTNVDFIDDQTELVARPQTQVGTLDYYNTIRAAFYGARGLKTLKPSIGVLGPIQGGTLPMLQYCARALGILQQRIRPIDVSEFAQGYHAISKVITNETNRATAQGNYVEMLSQLVLDSVVEKPIDILLVMAQAPLSGRVLTELRRRGIITVLWFVEDYQRFTSWQSMAPYYDFIFTIQKDECISAIKGAGCQEVHYLPTAADPFAHTPLALAPEEIQRWGSDVSFVGAGYHNRQQMFAALAGYPFKIWGTEWPTMKPFDRMVQEEGRRLTPEEYVKIFNATKVNLNLHSSTERDGIDPGGDFINPRTFELAACSAFQLVDPRKYLNDFFVDGEDVATFQNAVDLKEKIDFYLAHPEERSRIAQNSRNKVLSAHTYEHRIKQMLSIVYSVKYEHLKSRIDASPWRRIVERSKFDPELHRRCEAAFVRGEEPGLDGLLADIVTGKGALSETEQKLLFIYHISKQMIRMKYEEMGN